MIQNNKNVWNKILATYKSIRYSLLIGLNGQVLLKTITTRYSSSDLQFTTGITSEYKEYLFVAAGFRPEESNKVVLSFKFQLTEVLVTV